MTVVPRRFCFRFNFLFHSLFRTFIISFTLFPRIFLHYCLCILSLPFIALFLIRFAYFCPRIFSRLCVLFFDIFTSSSLIIVSSPVVTFNWAFSRFWSFSIDDRRKLVSHLPASASSSILASMLEPVVPINSNLSLLDHARIIPVHRSECFFSSSILNESKSAWLLRPFVQSHDHPLRGSTQLKVVDDLVFLSEK